MTDERSRTAGPVEGSLRGGAMGGLAAGAITGDPFTSLLVALLTAIAGGAGNWGRKNEDEDGWKGFFAMLFGRIGG